MNDEHITEDGEVISRALTTQDTAALSAITRAEIDSQIATARAYPRNIKISMQRILMLATLDEQTAEESIYALPRGGKSVEGPSVRLAEIISQNWGNCRVEARVVMVDRTEKVVVAEGIFHDLETNMATRATVRRRIVDSKGRLYNDDMITMTGNAACSIARRNATLQGVPRGVWRKAYEEARYIVAGDATTLSATREKAIKALAHYGLKPEQILVLIGVETVDDITTDHVVSLRGTFSALKNGETTVEELLRTSRATQGTAHEKVADPLANVPKEQSAPAAAGQDKPADSGDKPADPQAAGGSGEHTTAADAEKTKPAEDGQKAPAEPRSFSDEELDAYRQKGHKRGKAGGARALPKDLQTFEMRHAASAYFEGYDTAKAEAEGDGDA